MLINLINIFPVSNLTTSAFRLIFFEKLLMKTPVIFLIEMHFMLFVFQDSAKLSRVE